MNKKIIIGIVAVLVVGGSFYAGMKYDQNTNKGPGRNIQGVAGQFGNRRQGAQAGVGAGFVNGSIISKDDKSITIKSRDGGSKIVFIGGTTAIMKSTEGSLVDLSVGQEVTGMGTANPDGSITASSVQIRPAGMGTTTNPR